MISLRAFKFVLPAFVGVFLATGCNRSASAPPAPLPIDQLPAALQKAFTKAKPEDKALVDQLVATVQAQDYSKSFFQMQNLAAQPGLNKEQQNVTSRGVLTLNTLLQSAQTKGDVQATETLKTYRVNK